MIRQSLYRNLDPRTRYDKLITANHAGGAKKSCAKVMLHET